MEEKISLLLDKIGLPKEFLDILKNEAFRISLDNGMPFHKGIVLHSQSTEKMRFMQIILDLIKQSSSQLGNVANINGNFEFSSKFINVLGEDGINKLRKVKGIFFIDLDNFDIEEENNRSIERFSESISANLGVIEEIKRKKEKIESQKQSTDFEEQELERYDKLIAIFNSELLKYYSSPFRIFYGKKIKLAKENKEYCISSYEHFSEEINNIIEYNEQIDKLCHQVMAEINRILANNNLLATRKNQIQSKLKQSVSLEQIHAVLQL